MLWSYHWRAFSPEKQGSRGGSEQRRWAEMGSGTSGEASWFKPLTLGLLEAHKANKISHQGALVQDPAVWGGCLHMVLQTPPRMSGRACGRLNALKRNNREQLFARYWDCSQSAGLFFILGGLQWSDGHLWAAATPSQHRHCRQTPESRLLLGKLCRQAVLLELLTNP